MKGFVEDPTVDDSATSSGGMGASGDMAGFENADIYNYPDFEPNNSLFDSHFLQPAEGREYLARDNEDFIQSPRIGHV